MSSMWPRFFVPPAHPLPRLQGLRLHLLGVRGRGMGPAALAASAAGAIVDGCDATREGATALGGSGIHVELGHDPAHLDGKRLVATTIVSPRLPEVRQAFDAGVAHHRADLLAALIRDRRPLSVTGTKGKGTVTALVGLALAELGDDPLVLVGVAVPQLGGPLRLGSGRAVAEADESDGTIARIPAEISVVTNVWFDHAHYPRTLRETLDSLAEHLDGVPRTGRVLLGPGRHMSELEAAAGAPVWRVGRDVRAKVLSNDGVALRIRLGDPEAGSVIGRMRTLTSAPEEHAALTFAALRAAGHGPDAAASALGALTGISRRFELVGTAAGVRIFDDHGNQPEPVRRTIRSLRALRPRRLHAVFEPHRNEAILRWGRRLALALAEADRVVLLPIDEEVAPPRRAAPADWYVPAGLEVDLVHDRGAAVDLLRRTVRGGDVVCFMGGRDSQGDVARALLGELGS